MLLVAHFGRSTIPVIGTSFTDDERFRLAARKCTFVVISLIEKAIARRMHFRRFPAALAIFITRPTVKHVVISPAVIAEIFVDFTVTVVVLSVAYFLIER